MKFESFSRLFGHRWSGKRSSTGRSCRRRVGRRHLLVEPLERREMPSSNPLAPRVVDVRPVDRSTSTDPRPQITVTFSEEMFQAPPGNPQFINSVTNPANYRLFGSTGNLISIDSVSYSTVTNTATLSYNAGANLPADDYTLFIVGDRLRDLGTPGTSGPFAQTGPLFICPPGQVVAANSGGSNVSVIDMPGDGQLGAISNYQNLNIAGGLLPSTPVAVRISDVNRDGIGDLIVLAIGTAPGQALSGSIIEVYLGRNGDEGGFSNVPQVFGLPAAAAQPVALRVVDLNNDAAPDLLVVSQSGNGGVTVLRNNGQGQFVSTLFVSTSLAGAGNMLPVDVTAADFNGDGNFDLAVANSVAAAGGLNLTVLAGNAAGQFGPPVGFNTGIQNLTSIATINFNRRDFDVDDRPEVTLLIERPDVVVGGENGLAIMANLTRFPTSQAPTPGAFLFNAAQTLAAAQVTSLDVADLNGPAFDGVLDPDIVVLSNAGNGQVLTFLNSGPDQFLFNLSSTVNANPRGAAANNLGLTLAQVNNDAIPDLLLVNDYVAFAARDTVSVLLGTGGGTFTPPSATQLNIVGSGPAGLGVFSDRRFVDVGGNPIDPAFDAAGNPTNPNYPRRIEVVATANSFDDDVTTLRLDPRFNDGRFLVSVETPAVGASDITATASGDLNGDGLIDLVIANSTTDNVFVFLATSPTSYAPPLAIGVGSFPVALAIGNFGAPRTPEEQANFVLGARDLPDIVVVNRDSNTITILANISANPRVVQFARTDLAVGPLPTGVALADFNKDGILDIAVSHNRPFIPPTLPTDRGVTLLLAAQGKTGTQASPTFQPPREIVENVQAVAVAAADFNLDGVPDLAILENVSGSVGSVVYLRGNLIENNPATAADNDVSFLRVGTFRAEETPTTLAVGDLNRDGFPDLVVANSSSSPLTTNPGIAYLSVLLNDRGREFLNPIRRDILDRTRATITSLFVTDVNRDLYPDVVGSFSDTFLGRPVNTFFAALGDGSGQLREARQYASEGGGNRLFATNLLPTFLTVASNPFLRLTQFSTRGTVVRNNLIVNGNFEALDLAREAGNLVGWQTAKQRDSHGYWAIQTGSTSTLSGSPVTQPSGVRRAMLDQPDKNLRRTSTLGIPTSLGNEALGPDENRIRKASDYEGAHALYQDFLIPVTTTSVEISFSLYINNNDLDQQGGNLNQTGFSNPALIPQLDYFPNLPNRPANQQVRVDLIDPNGDIFGVNAGPGGNVLRRIFQTVPGNARIFTNGSTFRTERILGGVYNNTVTVRLTEEELASLRGRRVRLRFAAVNNQGRLIVGVDNVQVAASYSDLQAPSLNFLRLRNPGFVGPNPNNLGSTTDPTVIGRVSDEGTASNIDTITFDMDNDGRFDGPNDLPFGRFDAVGNFEFRLPLELPGPYTIGVQVADRAGNLFTTSFSFTFQGPSLDTFQAQGPGPMRFSGSGIRYSTVSGRVTALATDPRDTDGNTIFLGSANGGIWRTTDGGQNWTPLTQFLNDPVLGPIPPSIGAIAIDPSNPDHIYAATGISDLQQTSQPGLGILRSRDAGRTWQLVGNPYFDGARISKLVVSRRGLDGVTRIYAAVASGGRIRQSDGTFALVNGTGAGVLLSTDGGETWTNILDPARMILEDGTTVIGGGAAIISVTDLVLDRNSLNEQTLWIGLGDIGLITDGVGENTAGVWQSPDGGRNWFRKGGGQLPADIPNQTIPTGPGVRRVTLAIPQGRPSDQGIVYALINNPQADENTNQFSGLYKTRTNGLGWTRVMLRERKAVPGRFHNYTDLDLFGDELDFEQGDRRFIEQDSVGNLLVDPNNPHVVYIGGSTRFDEDALVTILPDGPQRNPHGLIRVDTSNMRDTSYVSPFVARPPQAIPGYNPPGATAGRPRDIPNDGDDIFKAADAALNNTNLTEPGVYANIQGQPGAGEAYEGEGVFWYDMQKGATGGEAFVNYGALRLPATVYTMTFDAQGRLLVGTLGGVWRTNTQGFVYDVTSGSPFSIESEAGETPPVQPSITFTDLNGNLQIADASSVAIDPINPQTLHASLINLGFARTTGGLPNSLQWVSTIDDSVLAFRFGGGVTGTGGFDPFVQLAPFAGVVRTGPVNPSTPEVVPPFSTVYRTQSNRGEASQFELAFATNLAIEKSNLNGEPRTFVSVVNGIDFSRVPPIGNERLANVPPLAVRPGTVQDDQGFPLEQLLFGTQRIFRSNNGALTWDQISQDLGGGAVTALAIAQSQPDAFYVGTEQGRVFSNIDTTTSPFENRSNGLPAGLSITGLAVDPTNHRVAYVTLDGFRTGAGRVFKTTDAGRNWINISGAAGGSPLPDLPAYSVVVDPRPLPNQPNGKIFVGTQVGLFTSVDDGRTWTQLSQGLPNVPVRDLAFNPDVEQVAAATFGGGIFTISTDQIGPRVLRVAPTTPVHVNSLGAGGLTGITVVFNERVDPRTFTLRAIRLLRGPNGPIVPTAITPAPNPRTGIVDFTHFVVSFPAQPSDGPYEIQLEPIIRDFVGNVMDQNNNLTPGERPNDVFLARFALNSSDNGAFVSGAYRDLLRRRAETEGFLAFVGGVDEARMQGMFQVAQTRVASQEARTNLLREFYLQTDVDPLAPGVQLRSPLPIGNFLRRPIDPTGLQVFLDALNAGTTPEQIINLIVGSAEYYQLNGNNNPGFVNQLYRDLFNRPADPAGLSFWLDFLNRSDEGNRAANVNIVVRSLEYHTTLVRGYFFRFLGREASDAELPTFVGPLQAGATAEQIIAALLGSEEYFIKRGVIPPGNTPPTNEVWLASVYNDLLGRAPDPDGTAFFLGQLAAGKTRQEVAAQVLASDEYRRSVVRGQFVQFLGRQPSPAELDMFAAMLASGFRQEDLTVFLVASSEYYQAQRGLATNQVEHNRNWVAALFRDVLGRRAGLDEINLFASRLTIGEERARTEVAAGFTSSSEYITRIVSLVYDKYLSRTPSPQEVVIFTPLLRAGPQPAGKPNVDELFISVVVSSTEFLRAAPEDRPLTQAEAENAIFNPFTGTFNPRGTPFHRDIDPTTPGIQIQPGVDAKFRASNTNLSWVRALYWSTLGRASDPAGEEQALLAVLGSYNLQRVNLATGIVTSDEYRQERVKDYFLTYLRRRATAAELAANVDLLRNGAPDEEIIRNLLASAEYFQNPNLGNNDNSVWLNSVYRDVLGRERDAGSQGFLNALNNGSQTRSQVAELILNSDEYRNRLITQLYSSLLTNKLAPPPSSPSDTDPDRNRNRVPASAELDFWRNRIASGDTLETVLAQILASNEYFLNRHLLP